MDFATRAPRPSRVRTAGARRDRASRDDLALAQRGERRRPGFRPGRGRRLFARSSHALRGFFSGCSRFLSRSKDVGFLHVNWLKIG